MRTSSDSLARATLTQTPPVNSGDIEEGAAYQTLRKLSTMHQRGDEGEYALSLCKHSLVVPAQFSWVAAQPVLLG